jgi:glycosyltransferase involved in cell wall biosynthesis
MEARDCGAPLRALIVMPVGEQRGGAEHQLEQLIEYRDRARLDPAIAFLKPGPMVAWCHARGVRTFVIDSGRLRQPRTLGRTVRALIAAARETRAQVVIGWMAKGQVYGGLGAVGARLPSVWLQPAGPSGLAPIDRAATVMPAKLVVTVSRCTDRAQRKLRPRRPTTVIYPAVDTGRFDAGRIGDERAVRRRLGLPEDSLVFGSVGRLNSWKGFHVLLDAAAQVLERHPQATLVIVGGAHELEPEYAKQLHDQARRLGHNGRVRLVGQQPNPEEWMQAMDVFVHTSRHEPFGMVVIEAMALGKAVIAGDQGGPTEVITPGVDGLLSPFGDEESLAAAILRLFDDAKFRGDVGLAAKQRAQDFTVQEFADRFGAAVAQAATPLTMKKQHRCGS